MNNLEKLAQAAILIDEVLTDLKKMTGELAPIKAAVVDKKLDFNPNLCNWQPREGSKGKYEMAKDGTNYRYLTAYLAEHDKQSATLEGYFYWLFTDGSAVGRKQKGVA